MAYDTPLDPVAYPQDDQATASVITRQNNEDKTDAEKAKDKLVDEFVKRATGRWTVAAEAEELQRRRSLEEVEFDGGKHWDEGMRKEREEKDRVVIEINRTPQYLNQVANEERIARPAINVVATGYGADPQTALVKAGIVRSIEKRSGAEGIRDDAFYRMLQKGWAYYRVNDEFENARSFRRVIRTRDIANDFAVYCDPAAVAFTREDSRFYFITEDVPLEEYKADYPDSKITASLTGLVTNGDQLQEWISKDIVRVAEYYYKVRTPMKLYALPAEDPDDDMNYIGKFEDEMTAIEMAQVVRDDKGIPVVRMSSKEVVYWCKINAVEILDGNDDLTAGRPITSKFIPIVFLPGRKIKCEGKDIYVGMIRDAMEPCLASDYWLSAITELVALAPKAPWVAAAKGIANYREEWLNANQENYATLTYDHVDESGVPIPAPTRSMVEPPIQAMTSILRFADDDLKRVMGIYNAGLGAPGPETSGVAIRNRQSESDVANYNYIDNLKRTIYFESRIYLDMIPKIYDEPQMVEITRPDGTTQMQAINKYFTDNEQNKKIYDLTKENYDSIVEIGASYETKREQASQSMMDYLKIDPSAAPLVGDLLARNQDNPDRLEFERRLKSRVPPDLLKDDMNDIKVPPQFQAQYDKQSQMLQQMTQAMQQLHDEVDKKVLEHQQAMELKKMELESQERQTALKAQVQLAGYATKADLAVFETTVDQIRMEVEAFKTPDQAPNMPTAPAVAPEAPAAPVAPAAQEGAGA